MPENTTYNKLKGEVFQFNTITSVKGTLVFISLSNEDIHF